MGWIESRPNKFLNQNFVRQGPPAKCKTRCFRFISLTLKKKILFLMVVIFLVLQSLLSRPSNGDIITCPISILKMTYAGTSVLPSAVLMAVSHSFVYPAIPQLTSLDVVVSITYTRHFEPVKISVHLSVGATRNVSLLILASSPGMHVRRFTITPHSWTNFQLTTGSLCYG